MRFYLRALSYFRKDWGLVLTLVLLIGLSLTVGLLQAWPMGILADTILTPMPRTDWVHRLFGFLLAPFPKSTLAQIVGITVIYMLLKLVQDTTTLARNMINHRMRYNGLTRARAELFAKLQELSPAYHKSHAQGDLIYRVGNDVWGIFGILDTFVATGVSAVTLVVMALVMLSRSVPITLVALTAVVPLLVVNLHFGRTLKCATVNFKRADSDLTTFLQRSLSAMGLIQLCGRQGHESRRFRRAVRETVESGMYMNWQEQLYPLIVQVIFGLGGAIIFGYGGYLVYRDSVLHKVPNGFTIADVIAFVSYLQQLWDPLGRLVGFTAVIQGNNAAAERVFAVLDEVPSVTDPEQGVRMPVRPRRLSLCDVGFSYPSGARILDGLDAEILPGRMVAFVGGSGTGKTTLLNLLPRFYDPTGGSVRLDGVDAREIRLADLRRHVALVQQDSVILAGSVAENIAYARPGATRAEIAAAAELAGAGEFIRGLPHGYDTRLTEGGQNLSGGQRQRIAIARALLTGAPILVLDEPTSALDPRQEEWVIRTLRRLKRQRTIILVTHRLQSVADCDEIYVLQDGHIVERGTHHRLLQAEGVYSAMACASYRERIESRRETAGAGDDEEFGGDDESVTEAA